MLDFGVNLFWNNTSILLKIYIFLYNFKNETIILSCDTDEHKEINFQAISKQSCSFGSFFRGKTNLTQYELKIMFKPKLYQKYSNSI